MKPDKERLAQWMIAHSFASARAVSQRAAMNPLRRDLGRVLTASLKYL